MEKEFLKGDEYDLGTCICGNMSHCDGFYPCDPNGHEVEGTDKDWNEPLYVCARCGRIINSENYEVVGRNENPIMLS